MSFKVCRVCGKSASVEQFHKHKGGKYGADSICKPCSTIRRRRHKVTPPSKEQTMLAHARYRAKKKGLQCDIDLSDIVIPERCPVLHIPMVKPSLDRLIPSLGYIKGNVNVISHRANMLKSDSELAEIELLVVYMRRMYATHNEEV